MGNPVITLLTDFGLSDPYVGILKGIIADIAPNANVIDLTHLIPPQNIRAGALALDRAYQYFPAGTIHLAVVDPGVGSKRRAIAMQADQFLFVGPDNGLFTFVIKRAEESHREVKTFLLENPHYRLEPVSPVFHGRDLFALIAADIAIGEFPTDKLSPIDKLQVEFDAGDLARVIYIDHYGNAWTGVRGVSQGTHVSIAGKAFKHSESFGFVGKGEGFWFINSVGLLELAINRGSAAATFGLKVGDPVQIHRQRLN